MCLARGSITAHPCTAEAARPAAIRQPPHTALGRGATIRHHSTEANARRAATTGTGITATGHGDNIPPRGTGDPVSPAADTTMPVTPSAAGAAFPPHSTGAPAAPAATIMMLRTASAMSRFPTTGQHIASIAQPAGIPLYSHTRPTQTDIASGAGAIRASIPPAQAKANSSGSLPACARSAGA